MNRNNFLVENFIEVIIDSHTIVKNNTAYVLLSFESHLVSPNSNFLQNYSTISHKDLTFT